MDNITELVLHNFTNTITDEAKVSQNWTLSNVTSRTHTERTHYPRGYYGDAIETVWRVVPPIILAWGLIGNFLTFVVLLRQMKRKITSTSLYLMALAFSDSVILLCGPLRHFIKHIWKKDVRNLTDAGCRMQLYFTYSSVHLSSWLLVAVTMERVLSVTIPHKVKFGCTPKIAGIVIFVTFISVFGLNICVPVINGQDAYMKKVRCAPTREEYLNFRNDIWQWIDFCVAFAIPFIFLLIGNIVIIVHQYKTFQRKKRVATSYVTNSKTNSNPIPKLILLCFVFFFTMTPASIFHIYQPYRLREIQRMPTYKEAWYAYQYLIFQHAIVNLIGYTNAAFNFVLYVLSGSKFRNELKRMFGFCFKINATVEPLST